MKSLLLIMLRAYKLGISPLLGQHCRFYPSCSDYAQQAITTHGALRGSLLAGWRLCKCHPWHPGGVDRVPPHSSSCEQRTEPDAPVHLYEHKP
ncbi:MAG: membrane protein insertion efficiency factor YidD [Oxalobacteraceae bacterium]